MVVAGAGALGAQNLVCQHTPFCDVKYHVFSGVRFERSTLLLIASLPLAAARKLEKENSSFSTSCVCLEE
jgi:hypothetical protein